MHFILYTLKKHGRTEKKKERKTKKNRENCVCFFMLYVISILSIDVMKFLKIFVDIIPSHRARFFFFSLQWYSVSFIRKRKALKRKKFKKCRRIIRRRKSSFLCVISPSTVWRQSELSKSLYRMIFSLLFLFQIYIHKNDSTKNRKGLFFHCHQNNQPI
jgi:hypothetical protein